MRIADRLTRPSGHLMLTAYDRTGHKLWTDGGANLIVDSGYAVLSDALTGVAGSALSHVEVGTRGDEPTPADTAITEPLRIEITTERNESGVRINFTIGIDAAVGKTIREFGIVAADGRLFARRVREGIEKTEYMSIVGRWDINF